MSFSNENEYWVTTTRSPLANKYFCTIYIAQERQQNFSNNLKIIELTNGPESAKLTQGESQRRMIWIVECYSTSTQFIDEL